MIDPCDNCGDTLDVEYDFGRDRFLCTFCRDDLDWEENTVLNYETDEGDL